MKNILLMALVSSSVLFVSCGGSDGPKTSFLGLPIEGISYKGETGPSGTTNDKGEFSFTQGDTVTFSIGDVELLKTKVDKDLSIKTFSGMDLITNDQLNGVIGSRTIDVKFELRQAFNALIFLATLDDDRDISNGIKISSDTIGKLKEGEIYPLNFTLSTSMFRDKVRKVLKQIELKRPVANSIVLSRFAVKSGAFGDPAIFYVNSEIQYDSDGNGTVDEIVKNTYDKDGNRTEYSDDSDANGTPNGISTFKFDDHGNTTRIQSDNDGNGTIDYDTIYKYDSDDNLLEYKYDSDGNGTFDQITKYTYDDYGNMLTYKRDTNGDGVYEESTTYTFDKNGNQTKQASDSNNDGTVDYTTTYTYDKRGNQTSEVSTHTMFAPSTIKMTYDKNDNQTRYTEDNETDGTLDYIEENDYNDAHEVTSRRVDSDGNGVWNRITTTTFDSHFTRTRLESDTDANGSPNSITTYTHDKNGLLTELAQDTDANGTPNNVTKYTFDSHGNQITYERDNNNDGVIDTRYTYSYKKLEGIYSPVDED